MRYPTATPHRARLREDGDRHACRGRWVRSRIGALRPSCESIPAPRRHRAGLRRRRLRGRAALHGRSSVVLVDEADPAWHRRGMAFTNAWYVGNAELDGEGACFCASLKSIPSVLAPMIAATTWSWPGVAGALDAAVLVDTRQRRRRGSEACAAASRSRSESAATSSRAWTSMWRSTLAELRAADLLSVARRKSRRENREHDRGAIRRRGVRSRPVHDRAADRRRGSSRSRSSAGSATKSIAAPATGVLLGLAAAAPASSPAISWSRSIPPVSLIAAMASARRNAGLPQSVLAALAAGHARRGPPIGRRGRGIRPVATIDRVD